MSGKGTGVGEEDAKEDAEVEEGAAQVRGGAGEPLGWARVDEPLRRGVPASSLGWAAPVSSSGGACEQPRQGGAGERPPVSEGGAAQVSGSGGTERERAENAMLRCGMR